MKNKSEVAEVFLKFKVMVENQSDCKLKMVRSDNRAKYTSEKGVKKQAGQKIAARNFTGYSSIKKCYRIYNPFSKKMIISRDVKFDKWRN
ncbi:Integrase, catalytic core [Gossypium australe]|uniref:Integrase, catalytic core n=1 Tax=Gossypium australe TaxID=47621 RepID=A0A5B6U652_9ROSI|nr:Integrase, catalytic core [Gossypium australe]